MIAKPLRRAVYDHVYANPDHEVGGVLVGRLDGSSPHVTGTIAALEAIGDRASVTFTHESWAAIHERLEQDFPEQQIVGWYHSHPGLGIFLSDHDRFIHRYFFSDAGQIAYVVDPIAGTEGTFGWRSGVIAELDRGPAGRRGLASRAGRRRLTARLALLAALLLGLVAAGIAERAGDHPETAARPAPVPSPADGR